MFKNAKWACGKVETVVYFIHLKEINARAILLDKQGKARFSNI